MNWVNNGQKIRLPVDEQDVGRTLNHYFERRYWWFRELDVAACLAGDRFTVDGLPARRETVLREGSLFCLRRPPWTEPPVPEEPRIVFESEDLLVVDKPAGIPTTPGGAFLDHSLLYLLRKRLDLPDLSPLHRLDLETSGILAFSKRKACRGFFQVQFQRRSVEKRYLALVFGKVNHELDLIDFCLAPDSRIFTKFVRNPAGKDARTEVLQKRYWRNYTLLTLRPVTGRTNQIRAHLAGIGHRLVGDKKYADQPELFLDWLETKDTEAWLPQLKLPRQALHCQSLELEIGGGQGRREFRSDRPVFRDWRDQIRQLED